MEAVTGSRIWSYRDSAGIHLVVGALVCFFILSPALFTPWGFGPDFTNHLWLVWQQGVAISNTGHPTLYLQQPGGIFEPFYGFYGGTLYATVGAAGALIGTGHVYALYIVSYAAAFAMAYGGMWWLGRQIGLSRWLAHLPAFVTVTAAYYLTDAYARGAWPELVSLSAVPLFVAGGAWLMTHSWRWGQAALFLVATVALTGSHNITLLWSAIVIAPVAVVFWLVVGSLRPSIRQVAALACLTLLGIGINAWFLVLDLSHSGDTQAWTQNIAFLKEFSATLYFDNLGNVLDPLRHTPAPSTTYGLAIAAPVAAFVFGLVITVMSRPTLRAAGRPLQALWLVLMATMAVLVVFLIMPGSWWVWIGAPFTDIQFPYRLAGWLLIAIALQLAISLRFARALVGSRRQIAVILGIALIVATIAQAAAQLYAAPRLDGETNGNIHPRAEAFVNGPTTPPGTFYDPFSYSDSSQPVVKTPPERIVYLPTPAAGGTRSEAEVRLGKGAAPIATNIAAGPYVVSITGMKQVGRTEAGSMVVTPEDGQGDSQLVVRADAGRTQAVGTLISILCLIGAVGVVGTLAIRPKFKNRPRPTG